MLSMFCDLNEGLALVNRDDEKEVCEGKCSI